MSREQQRQATRHGLLTAAGRVIQEAGVQSLTLELVARTAGVSKGGLLYHFPSKEALIAALVEDRLARFDEAMVSALALEDEAMSSALAHEPEATPGRWLRAYVRLTFAPPEPGADLTAALLAAAATDPALLAPVWAAFARWHACALADGLDPATATLIRLAADGLWLADLFGSAVVAAPLRAEAREALLRLVDASAARRAAATAETAAE